MQKHNICMNFNKTDANNEPYCKESGSHKNKYNEKVNLLHICAGCHAKDGSRDEHPVSNCKKHNFSTLF